jgi:hypothetical protein
MYCEKHIWALRMSIQVHLFPWITTLIFYFIESEIFFDYDLKYVTAHLADSYSKGRQR